MHFPVAAGPETGISRSTSCRILPMRINPLSNMVATIWIFFDQAFHRSRAVMKCFPASPGHGLKQNTLTAETIMRHRQTSCRCRLGIPEEEIPSSIKQSRAGLTRVIHVRAMKELLPIRKQGKELVDLAHVIRYLQLSLLETSGNTLPRSSLILIKIFPGDVSAEESGR